MINRKQTTFVNKKEKKRRLPFYSPFLSAKKKERDNFPLIPLVLNFIFLGDNKLPFKLRYTYL